MHFSVEPSKSGKTFGIAIHKSEGVDPFLVIKGCRIGKTNDGKEFISGPSSKMDDGKYFNYTYLDKAFGDHMLKIAKSVMSEGDAPAKKQAQEDVPF